MGVLDGQVALMFGASGGIGRATAIALAEAGASVALAARRASALMELASSIGTRGYKAIRLEEGFPEWKMRGYAVEISSKA